MPSKIPYCNEVLEVTGGCTKCSPGCKNDWAIKEVWRLAHNSKLGDKWQGLVEKTASGLNWTGRIKLFEEALEKPLRRKKPTTYFVDSKADLFHPKVLFEYINSVLGVIALCPQHTFLILTKRVERMLEYMQNRDWGEACNKVLRKNMYLQKEIVPPLPNLWLGVTAENQRCADERIPILLQIPAAVRFVSLEPLLERIDLIGKDKNRMGETGYLPNYLNPFFCNDCGKHLSRPSGQITQTCGYCGSNSYRKENSIHQVIIGCESINGRPGRHCSLDDVRFVVEQCKDVGVPVFVKQLHIDGKLVRDMSKFPTDLRLQEYPKLLRK